MSFKIFLQAVPWLLLVLLIAVIVIPACAPRPDTAGRVKEYKTALSATSGNAISAADPQLAKALESFEKFLQNLGDSEYVTRNTSEVYADDAYLNDTLVTHHGPEEIREYFLTTADTMESYEVTIDGIASSGIDHYVRWTMVFQAPKLNKGNPVESVGMSHVRFNRDNKVTMHQDYWDSGMNIYGQLPVLGGAIESIRRRF